MPEEPAAGSNQPALKTLPLVQREVVLFFVLCAIAVVMFLVTRTMAEWSRQNNSETAAAWYARGQQRLAAGDLQGGVTALRRAFAMNRTNVEYVLALARGLTLGGPNEEAWQLLQGLRESQPEDTEINYRLAGLAAERGEYADAVRYYNHALFGLDAAPVPSEGPAPVAATGAPKDATAGSEPGASAAAPPAGRPPVTRSMILTDLATLQLSHGDIEEALSTLATLARVSDGDPAARVRVGQLFAMAGDQQQALSNFTIAIGQDASNVDAQLGAADAAFSLGRFTESLRHLVAAERAGATGTPFEERLALVDRVVDSDPLAPALGMTERVRRLTAGLDWAAARFDHCAEQPNTTLPDETRKEIEALRKRPRQELRDTDVLTEGVTLIGASRAVVAGPCPTTDVADTAWATIARARGASR
ncbi:MAG: tetratricopeptide repeat protein [Vicinamibacterales bacterium]